MARSAESWATSTPIILAFAASPRLLGLAVTLPSGPVLLRTLRVEPSSRSASLLEDRVSDFLRRRPVAAVVSVREPTDPREHGSARHVLERARSVVDILDASAVELERREIAHVLGLAESTRAAIRRDLVRRYPLVAALTSRARGQRSETERYWELAILAAAGAEAFFRMTH